MNRPQGPASRHTRVWFDDPSMRLPTEVVGAVAIRQGGVVTVEQLVGLGADRAWIRRQVDRAVWQRLATGVVLTHSGPVTWLSRAWAALLHAGPEAALSHEAAAHLHGFLLRPPPWVDVTIPGARRVRPSLSIVLHRSAMMPPSAGRPRRTWRGDTVVDLVAASRSDDEAVGWVCDAVRAGARPHEIAVALDRRRRVRSGPLLRDLIEEAAEGVESPLERRYHREVERRHGLPRSVLQVRQVVGGTAIRTDALYEGLGVRAELDGGLAHPGGRIDADTWRDNAVLIERGEVTLRYRWRHVVVTPCATAAQVAAALQARGWTGRPRPCGPACAVRATGAGTRAMDQPPTRTASLHP